MNEFSLNSNNGLNESLLQSMFGKYFAYSIKMNELEIFNGIY